MTTQRISTNTNLLHDHGDTVILTGHNTVLGMSYLSTDNTIFVRGTNDTVSMEAGSNHIYDQGTGTKLLFMAPALNEVVSGLQNDLHGIVEFVSPSPITYHMDGHGGVLATATGLSIDFLGFHSVAQLENHVRSV